MLTSTKDNQLDNVDHTGELDAEKEKEKEIKNKLLNKLIIKMLDGILKKDAKELIYRQRSNPTEENKNALHQFVESLLNKRLEKMLGIRINLNNLQVLTNHQISTSITNNDYDYFVVDKNDEKIIAVPDNSTTFDEMMKAGLGTGEIEFNERGDITLKAYIEEWDSDIDDIKVTYHDGDKKGFKSIEKQTEDEGNSLRSFMEEVETIEEMRSMCISMILDLKDRIKGCETCETCSQVVSIVETNLAKYKKVTKLAQHFATLLMYIIDDVIPSNLNEKNITLLNDLFVIIVKNSSFPDICYLYEKFKQYINVNIYNGIILRLAIQKYKAFEIRIILDWGCDITVLNHKPIIRAFYYEKFGLIKTLILKGSSYKYYLKAELSPKRYEKLQARLDAYIADEAPNASELEKEFQGVILINAYRKVLQRKRAMERVASKIRSEDFSDSDDDEIDDRIISKPGFIDDFVNFFYGSICNNPYYQLRHLINNKPEYIDKVIEKMAEDDSITTHNFSNPSNTDEPSSKTTSKDKKKKKKKKPHNPSMQKEIPVTESLVKNDVQIAMESYDALNEETFNLLETSPGTINDTITQPIETYFTLETNTTLLSIPTQTINHWQRDFPWCDGGIMLYWDWHFEQVMRQFTPVC